MNTTSQTNRQKYEWSRILDNTDCNESGANFTSSETLLAGLNPEQAEAVAHHLGPLLILAGAGSGKTRVITYRIAHLIRNLGVRPSSILAITFTNKAAAEMKERIRKIIGSTADYMWVGTFHSMFARILRRHAELIGYTGRYSIIDSDDQVKIVKEAIKEMDLNDKVFVPRNVLGEISRSKNDLISVEEYTKQAGSDYRLQKIASVYRLYAEKLRRSDCMDFDDILYYAVELLTKHPDVLTYYQEQFKYILVDEYQDTNHAQYKLILMLAKRYRNLCVVGDDDQSIYAFRGANIRNILDFEKDFKDTKVIKLETNYRSTHTILQAANSVIANNTKRKSKTLRSKIEKGDQLVHYSAEHHGAEAYYVVNEISRLVRSGYCSYGDIAILYRMNALSRTIESALREQGIPYRVYGGQRFYERKEIKDIMAYLRLTLTPSDEYAFLRIINVPKRGIGDTTVERIRALAAENNTSCYDICYNVFRYPELSRSSDRLLSFVGIIDDFRERLSENEMSFADFIDYVQDKSGLIQEIVDAKEKKGETVDRVENLRELLSEAVEFEQRRKNMPDIPPEGEDALAESGLLEQPQDPVYAKDLQGILQAYLENAALYSQGDENDPSEDYVRLMTIHSAKGLEFSVVFLVGAEDGIFPSLRSMERMDDLEEERRLMYVAITRAKKRFSIVTANSRMLFGQTQALKPSRFIKEIDKACLSCVGNARQVYQTPFSSFGSASSSGFTGGQGGGFVASAKSGEATNSKTYLGSVVASATEAKAAKNSEAFLRPDEVSSGMAVVHPRFGRGVVRRIERVAGDALVSIEFGQGTTKNMLLKQARLQKPKQ
ncbi:MAG TPA: UvrD-helicase domain-containing protein [Clostridiaceae bacterium]|nr:UvrD-helicase domain-containing protein [Clostridiaceae bacterium]